MGPFNLPPLQAGRANQAAASFTSTNSSPVSVAGTLDALVPRDEWERREIPVLTPAQVANNGHDLGRELFAGMRKNVVSAEQGACTWL